eukprot:Skav233260  [mRNA]  locus=scaffold2371:104531:106828:- [translate_table: standard]
MGNWIFSRQSWQFDAGQCTCAVLLSDLWCITGRVRDALAPSARLAKNPSDYEAEEDILLQQMLAMSLVTVGVPGMAAPSPSTSSASLKVGQTITGADADCSGYVGVLLELVWFVAVNRGWYWLQYGVFFNIGLGRDALCFTNQLDKELGAYKARCSFAAEDLSEAKVGQKVQGIVMTTIKAGIFFDAGFSSDVLAPPQLLSTELSAPQSVRRM